MYIKVRATAGARKEEIEKESESVYKIAVKEKAVRNQANQRIRFLLARELGVDENRVRLIAGHHTQSKMYSILDLVE